MNPIFRLLGAKPLTDMYETEVLSEYKSATEHELKRADFLFAFVESLFGRNFFYETRPKLYISDKSNADSLQFSERDYSKSSRRYKLGKIICRRTLLTESGFEEAVVAFVNILAESFSTKRSKKRAYVLTLLGGTVDFGEQMGHGGKECVERLTMLEQPRLTPIYEDCYELSFREGCIEGILGYIRWWHAKD